MGRRVRDRDDDQLPGGQRRPVGHRGAERRAPRIHGESNLNTFRDGVRVLRTIFSERLHRRRAAGAIVPAADSMGVSADVVDEAVANPVHAHVEVEHEGQVIDLRAFEEQMRPVRSESA
nr:hypothetical protein [Angustibacter aerolatus]